MIDDVLAARERVARAFDERHVLRVVVHVRDRDREFTEKDRPSKADVLKRFDDAIALVRQTITQQAADDWAKPYSAAREEDAANRFNVVLRCCTHLHHHVGQMMYLANGVKILQP